MDIFKHLSEIEEILGYTFRDKALLVQAFTRTSYCNEERARGKDYQSNEVLEFFGDAVLSAAIVSLLIRGSSTRYAHGIHTKLSEGDFSNVKSHLSDKSNLSVHLGKMGLERYLLMGEGDKKMGMENQPSVMEDLFESIVGAVYIDCEMQMNVVINVVSRMLDAGEYLEKGNTSQSAKNLLQEFCADKSRRLGAPRYCLVSESGPQHKKEYIFACIIGEKEYGRGTGKNHRAAESAAAEAALIRLQEEYAQKDAPAQAHHPADTPMSRLHEYATRRALAAPLYEEREAPQSTVREPAFLCTCHFHGRSTEAVGSSKRAAKQEAAKAMLVLLSD